LVAPVFFLAGFDVATLAKRIFVTFFPFAKVRVSRRFFFSVSEKSRVASANSFFARLSRFFARRAASFASFRLCLANLDSCFAARTEFSAAVSRRRASSILSSVVGDEFAIFMGKQSTHKAHVMESRSCD
jgi:hypothetical protein